MERMPKEIVGENAAHGVCIARRVESTLLGDRDPTALFGGCIRRVEDPK